MKNVFIKIYLKYIYFMLSILKIHLQMYVLNKNTLQLHFTKLVFLKSAIFEQIILYLMDFNCANVQLKIYRIIFDYAKVDLLQVHLRYTLNILHLKTDFI